MADLHVSIEKKDSSLSKWKIKDKIRWTKLLEFIWKALRSAICQDERNQEKTDLLDLFYYCDRSACVI